MGVVLVVVVVCVVCVWVCVCVCVSVRVLCVCMSVHSALYTCQVVQQTGEQHSCKVLDWVYDTDDGVVDAAPAELASTPGHQSWRTTGQRYWPAPLFSNTGE